MSPSPTAADFHTPLATPTGLTSSQPEAPKKKNKKRKKKTLATATATQTGPATAAPGSEDEEPFAGQFNEVADAERRLPRGGVEYYANHPPHPLESPPAVDKVWSLLQVL